MYIIRVYRTGANSFFIHGTWDKETIMQKWPDGREVRTCQYPGCDQPIEKYSRRVKLCETGCREKYKKQQAKCYYGSKVLSEAGCREYEKRQDIK